MQIPDAPCENEIIDMLRSVNLQLNRMLNDFYQPFGLTAVQALVLTALCRQESQSLSDLCAELGMGKSNLSPLCKRMEKEGLIEKVRSQEDQRVVQIRVTPRAQQIMKQVADNAQQGYQDILMNATELDRQRLRDGLRLLIAYLEPQSPLERK